jgi:hypothetical protein
MKKLYLFTAAMFSLVAFAQTPGKCATHDALLHINDLYPGYLDQVNETFERCKAMSSGDRSEVYTIPVVVHIVYEDANENLDDSVVYNQIQRLNEDFRRLNSDAGNVRDTFNSVVGDSFIEFELATVDPSGNPTTGITHTYAAVDSWYFYGGETFAEGVKKSSLGGVDPWDQATYMNIWVCDMSIFGTVAVLGYATPPDGLPNWPPGSTAGLSDGVVIQYQAFGANNPNVLDMGSGPITVLGRTVDHEVGHYLGLRHIWADGDCTEEDGVDDTPNADDASNFDCNTTKNTCIDAIGSLGDLPDMVENYMDYSEETCQNSFTNGQIDLMRGVLENERYELIDGLASLIEQEKISFNLYPNPGNGDIRLTDLPEGNKHLSVYTETGQLVLSEYLLGNQTELSGLSEGIYLVTVTTDDMISTEKMVILR